MNHIKNSIMAVLIFAFIALIQFIVGAIKSTMDGIANIGFPLYFKSFGGFPYFNDTNYAFLFVNILVWAIGGYLFSFLKSQKSSKAI